MLIATLWDRYAREPGDQTFFMIAAAIGLLVAGYSLASQDSPLPGLKESLRQRDFSDAGWGAFSVVAHVLGVMTVVTFAVIVVMLAGTWLLDKIGI